MKLLETERDMCSLIAWDLSCERCRNYVTHMRAVLYVGKGMECAGAGCRQQTEKHDRSLHFLLDALEKELNYSFDVLEGAGDQSHRCQGG